MSRELIVVPPRICGLAEVELAHGQMRRHRGCRIEHCGWKWVAYCTLVRHGRIVPQTLSPRERAHLRGIAFPADDAERDRPLWEVPEVATFQQVLDGLAKLALPPVDWEEGCAGKGEPPWTCGR